MYTKNTGPSKRFRAPGELAVHLAVDEAAKLDPGVSPRAGPREPRDEPRGSRGARRRGRRVAPFFENAFFEIFTNFWRARSRLYQNEILQENMRLTAFFKLYKICILLHRCNLKKIRKSRFEKSAFFVKIQQNLQILPILKKNQLDNLVDFEKCCKTRICSQRSVPIQPKTSEILPKNCQKLATTLRVHEGPEAAP